MPSLPPIPFTGSIHINSPGSLGGTLDEVENETMGNAPSANGLPQDLLGYINEIYKFAENFGTSITTVNGGASDSTFGNTQGPFGLTAEPTLQVKERTDTAANWTSNNPTLAAGEVGFESDTMFHKTGDGTKAWNDLRYDHGPPWLTKIDGGAPNSTYPGTADNTYDGVMTFAKFPEGFTDMVIIELQWFTVIDVCQDPDDHNVFYAVGSKEFAHSSGFSIAVIDREAETFVEHIQVGPFTDTVSITCHTGGILQVAEQSPRRAYWASTSDLTTWTLCTYNASLTGSAIQLLEYDPYSQLSVACFDTFIFFSLDGKAFTKQNYFVAGVGDNGTIPSYFYGRANHNELTAWYTGSEPSLVAGGETLWTCNIQTSPITTLQMTTAEVDPDDDVYGSSISTQKVISMAMNPASDTAWFLSDSGNLIRNTGNTNTYDQTSIVDVSSLYAGTSPINMGRIVDFNKMYIAAPGATQADNLFLETTGADGDSWQVSADSRFTALTPVTLRGSDWNAAGVAETICGVTLNTGTSRDDVYLTKVV